MTYNRIYGSRLPNLVMGNGITFRNHRYETDDIQRQAMIEHSDSFAHGKVWRVATTAIRPGVPVPDPERRPELRVSRVHQGLRGTDDMQPRVSEPEPIVEPQLPEEEDEDEEEVEEELPQTVVRHPTLPDRRLVLGARKEALAKIAESWGIDVDGMTRPQIQRALLKKFEPIWAKGT